MSKSIKRISTHASALAIAISLMPVGAYAAGLGKVTVLSPLGSPLRAEVDVTASREELSSMTAKVASPEAFQQAGIEYSPTMTSIHVILDKRPNGKPFLRMVSNRPVNDPFLDVLVELDWSSGRMVREYTMLLDPPAALKVVPAPVVAPQVKAPVAQTPAATHVPAVTQAPIAPAQPAPVAQPAQPSQATASAQPAAQATRRVKRGDTLSKIAGETKPEGVSLDQMLVALFRANRNVFDGANMNRLRAGKILTVPTDTEAAAVSPSEARKIVLAQGRDFNVYRRKLASEVAATPAVKEEGPKQEATGKIAPKVEAKAAPAPVTDKLEVSRTEAAKNAKEFQNRISALEEDLVARDKALKEATSRIAELEKNLNDLKKLAELKSQAGAQMQQQAQAAKPTPPAPLPEAKKAEPAPAATAETPSEPLIEVPKPPEKPAETAPAPTPATPETAAPPPTPAPTPAPVEAAKPKAKPAPPPPPVAEEPSFIDENATLVYGGGAVLVLLLGYLGYASMRRKRDGDLAPTTSRITEGDLMANSVFGSTGGQSVDTGASIQTDFSQSNLTSIDADEGVDPVAEADVYMAYGRDAQAEEILIDALKNDPTRHAIHLKLLEIYLGRKSVKQFESLATDLYGLTNGTGPDWEKAAGMGRTIDPENPLYGGKIAEAGQEESSPAPESPAPLVVPPSEVEKMRETVTTPGELGQMGAGADTSTEPEPSAPMDFDLDLGAIGADTSTDVGKEKEEAPLDLNLEIGLPPVEGAPMDATVPMGMRMTEPSEAAEQSGLDFEFDLDEAAAPAALEAKSDAVNVGSDIGTDVGAEVGTDVAAEASPKLDLSSIDLELEGGAPAQDVAGSDQDDPDVATKIELAQAYEEMGDKEGARELLQEVAQEGSVRQKEIARDKLALLEA